MTTTASRIAEIRASYGTRLAILGHHYQHDDVIRHTDFQGDSLELARKIDGLAAEHVVFCGVFFMAESAAALARPGQKIHIPDASATCPMAEMAPAARLEQVLTALRAHGRVVIPLAYVNSSAEVKSICGRFGGSVCTSANARVMLQWALGQGDAVLFLPDKNLGHNTADLLAIPQSDRLEIRIRKGGALLDLERAAKARLLLWPGACAIHHMFKARHVADMRAAHPGLKVIVHPECLPEIVQACDGAGSTTFLIKYCAEAPAGAHVAVGTELNLVKRLAARHPDKTILPLRELVCTNMAKISEQALLARLETLESAAPVTLPADIIEHSRVALERMLRTCA